MRKGLPSLLSGIFLLGGLVAADALADKSDLTQKAGTAGCVAETGGTCADGIGLKWPEGLAVSPDGKNVYVASQESGAVAVFDRAPDGTLTQKGGEAACIAETSADGCSDGLALSGASDVAVSPDGKNVYVASRISDAVAVFDRAADGSLKQKGPEAACVSENGSGDCADGEGLRGPTAVAVSPDGDNVYVSAWDIGPESDTIAVLERAPDGTLEFIDCVSETGAGSCADGEGMMAPEDIAVSPDGDSVYTASSLSDSVAYWKREPGDGSLTAVGCRSSTTPTPCDDSLESLDGAYSVAVSPDNANVYVAAAALGTGGLTIFDRDGDDGSLLAKTGAAGCVATEVAGRDCAQGPGLSGTASVAVSADGASVYAASIASSAVAAFDRNAGGTIAQRPGSAACIATGQGPAAPCAYGWGLFFATAVAVSPDGRNVYVAAQADSIAVLDRGAPLEPPPQPPPPPPGADTTAPVVESLAVKPGSFRAKGGGPSISVKSGSKVTYRLSEAAKAKFRIEQGTPGRKAGKKCVKETAANRKSKPCTRYKTLKGSFTDPGAAGVNSFKFSGRVGGRKLKPGSYRLAASATDTAGNASAKPRTAKFKIVD